MTFYDKTKQTFIYSGVLVNDKGTYFLDNCSDELLKELNVLKVNEPSYDPNYQRLEYSEINGVWVGVAKDFKTKEQYEKEHLISNFKRIVQERLDTKAREKGYDDIVSACSYAGYANDFHDEAVQFGLWRSRVWKWGYSLLEQYKDTNASELDLEELTKSMPEFEEQTD